MFLASVSEEGNRQYALFSFILADVKLVSLSVKSPGVIILQVSPVWQWLQHKGSLASRPDGLLSFPASLNLSIVFLPPADPIALGSPLHFCLSVATSTTRRLVSNGTVCTSML